MSKCIFVVEVNYLQIMLSTFRFVLKLSNIRTLSYEYFFYEK